MVIITSLDNKIYCEKSVLTIGSFDGIHLGHQCILKKVKQISAESNLPSVLITFNPIPKRVLSNNLVIKELITLDSKIDYFRKFNIEYLYILPFSEKFAKISAIDFLNDHIYKKFNPMHIVIGYDHRFGKDQIGNREFLFNYQNEMKYNLHIVEPFKIDNTPISSSKIRKYIEDGNIYKANNYLGRKFELEGEIVKGSGIGKKIGFPTLNIKPLSPSHVLPKIGVYCVDIKIGSTVFAGMCNIGYRPTVHERSTLTIEVHLIKDYEINIKNKFIKIIFKNYLRSEKKYSSINALIKQLKIDRKSCYNV